ncbi:MAG: hypothetical protein M1812_000453 [Candelaria pacifica]|nr:MAG: hypothetical protein M1812_000453 [Candelaria pacifica]
MTTFAEATLVKPVGSHSYYADFPADWCIGSVPHGGFVTSVFLQVASTHFRTTLSKQNQPHTITLHLEFVRRTQAGAATFEIQDLKLGRQTSTIHVTLTQNNRVEVIGYITNSNIHTETGPTYSTGFALLPASYPADVSKFNANKDQHWEEQMKMPFAEFRKASSKVRFFFPREGQRMRSIADEWMCYRNGDKFTNESLGYVADTWPQVVEFFKHEDDPYALKDKELATWNKNSSNWYPTLVLNLDIKKALPEEGVEWLFVRVQAKQIRNGRMDLEVIIMDQEGDIVALSHHVTLILGVDRNMAERKKDSSGSQERTKL